MRTYAVQLHSERTPREKKGGWGVLYIKKSKVCYTRDLVPQLALF